MSDLKKFRADLLTASDPAGVLTLADKYLIDMEKKGSDFILPAPHAAVLPVLEYYAGDMNGWLKFVKGVRDRFNPRSEQYKSLQTLYRKLAVRVIQNERRQRIAAAVAVALKKKLIENSAVDKARYERRCIQTWIERKENMLKVLRKKTGTFIDADVKSQALSDFWEMVDAEIDNGEVPKP